MGIAVTDPGFAGRERVAPALAAVLLALLACESTDTSGLDPVDFTRVDDGARRSAAAPDAAEQTCPQLLVRCVNAPGEAPSCVDLKSANRHCGACGRACAAKQVCSAGSCAVACANGETNCDGVCADTRTDPAHCGACGKKCESGACAKSACTACPWGTTACDGRCVNTQSDDKNCGICGNVCRGRTRCFAGLCLPRP